MPRHLSFPAVLSAFLLAAGLLAGCGSSDPAAQADAAQTALSTGDAAAARAKAEAGLKAAGADKNLAWRLERIRVEAIAKQGDSAEVVATMTRLGQAYPLQCDAPFYSKVANALAESGEGVGALEVANAGLQRFPDRKSDFEGLIEQLKQTAAAGDAELTAKLKSLGYL
jgi:hypothetical protein